MTFIELCESFNPESSDFSSFLREASKAFEPLGKSQLELARMAGVNSRTWTRWVAGKTQPRHTLAKAAFVALLKREFKEGKPSV